MSWDHFLFSIVGVWSGRFRLATFLSGRIRGSSANVSTVNDSLLSVWFKREEQSAQSILSTIASWYNLEIFPKGTELFCEDGEFFVGEAARTAL